MSAPRKKNTRNNEVLEKFTPNKYDVAKKIRAGKVEVFKDSDKRSYGIISKNHAMYNGWVESGMIDGDLNRVVFWITLPRISMRGDGPRIDFPKLGEQVELSNPKMEEEYGSFSVIEYPEKIGTRSRSTSIVLEKVL